MIRLPNCIAACTLLYWAGSPTRAPVVGHACHITAPWRHLTLPPPHPAPQAAAQSAAAAAEAEAQAMASQNSALQEEVSRLRQAAQAASAAAGSAAKPKGAGRVHANEWGCRVAWVWCASVTALF